MKIFLLNINYQQQNKINEEYILSGIFEYFASHVIFAVSLRDSYSIIFA